MAHRCGCAGEACPCTVIGGAGISIEGTGSASNPVVVTNTAIEQATGFLPRDDRVPLANALNVGMEGQAGHVVDIGHNTDDIAGVSVLLNVSRTANADEGFNLGKALRVKTVVNVTSSAQNEWAISGEADSYNDGSGNVVAVSGVAGKYGLASTFGGHFQAKDFNVYAAPTDVTGLVGAEINNPAVGLDHPTANQGAGNRATLVLIARTNDGVVSPATAEIGCGLHIHNNGAGGGVSNSGYYRYGILIDEPPGNPSAVTTGIQVNTTGPYGIRLQGDNSVAAIGLGTGQKVAFEGTGAITMSHEGSPNRIVMQSSGGVNRIQFEVSTTPSITIGTARVLNTRKQGWSVPTGTATRTAFATTTVTLSQLAERVKALIEDLHNIDGHGLIGT